MIIVIAASVESVTLYQPLAEHHFVLLLSL